MEWKESSYQKSDGKVEEIARNFAENRKQWKGEKRAIGVKGDKKGGLGLETFWNVDPAPQVLVKMVTKAIPPKLTKAASEKKLH